jgi:hypothetical protein
VGLRASLSEHLVIPTISRQIAHPRRHGSPAAGERPDLMVKRKSAADDRAAQEPLPLITSTLSIALHFLLSPQLASHS